MKKTGDAGSRKLRRELWTRESGIRESGIRENGIWVSGIREIWTREIGFFDKIRIQSADQNVNQNMDQSKDGMAWEKQNRKENV